MPSTHRPSLYADTATDAHQAVGPGTGNASEAGFFSMFRQFVSGLELCIDRRSCASLEDSEDILCVRGTRAAHKVGDLVCYVKTAQYLGTLMSKVPTHHHSNWISRLRSSRDTDYSAPTRTHFQRHLDLTDAPREVPPSRSITARPETTTGATLPPQPSANHDDHGRVLLLVSSQVFVLSTSRSCEL